MKKKINRRFVGIALFSVIITTVIMTVVFYTQLKKQVFSDLASVAEVLSNADVSDSKVQNIRITLIDAEGKVLHDSSVDAATLANHGNRPEVIDAKKYGTGKKIRRSDTLSEDIYYYAKLLENGQILRVGRESHSVLSIFISALPIVIGMTLLLLLLCLALSHFLTADIIRPIDNMVEEMDHINEEKIYEELIPFTRKIRTQHEEILSSTNMRQEFTANVSHELKTPLAAISGYAELMETGMVNEAEVHHFSEEIRKGAARLLTLINDIIKLSQLDSGYIKDVPELVNIAEIAEETVQMLSLNAAKSHIEISYSGVKEAYVRIGKEWAQELTYNLIENAIKYNRLGGSVDVKVTRKDGEISFIVQDTGIGIPKEHQERIFERFYRVDKSRSKELGGTGLGLAIVKHISNLTSGELQIDSKEGTGTLISVKWEADAFSDRCQVPVSISEMECKQNPEED